MTGSEWFDKELERLQYNISYHEKEYDEEVKRAKERTEWIKALRESLYE